MAQENKAISETSSIEAVLKNLSSRPNVQFTLVLSRKDGSIIKSTGFKETPSISQASHQDYTQSSLESKPTSDAVDLDSATKSEQEKSKVVEPSPAERLASSIFSFMRAADNLAVDVYSQESSIELFSSNRHSDTKGTQLEIADNRNTIPDDEVDVQLLRMRTRRQEVIIFPDTNYLCCVVQNTSRGGNTEVGK